MTGQSCGRQSSGWRIAVSTLSATCSSRSQRRTLTVSRGSCMTGANRIVSKYYPIYVRPRQTKGESLSSNTLCQVLWSRTSPSYSISHDVLGSRAREDRGRVCSPASGRWVDSLWLLVSTRADNRGHRGTRGVGLEPQPVLARRVVLLSQ